MTATVLNPYDYRYDHDAPATVRKEESLFFEWLAEQMEPYAGNPSMAYLVETKQTMKWLHSPKDAKEIATFVHQETYTHHRQCMMSVNCLDLGRISSLGHLFPTNPIPGFLGWNGATSVALKIMTDSPQNLVKALRKSELSPTYAILGANNIYAVFMVRKVMTREEQLSLTDLLCSHFGDLNIENKWSYNRTQTMLCPGSHCRTPDSHSLASVVGISEPRDIPFVITDSAKQQAKDEEQMLIDAKEAFNDRIALAAQKPRRSFIATRLGE